MLILLLVGCCRQGEVDSGAVFVAIGFDPNTAVVYLNNPLHQRQANARPSHRLIQPVK